MPASFAKSPYPIPSYDADFFGWTIAQAEALRRVRPGGLDWENVAEEIESLGKSDNRSIESNLAFVLLHLLKWMYQPEMRKAGWRSSIDEHRHRIDKLVKESPSLRGYPDEVIGEEYDLARGKAIDETGLAEGSFPRSCPFTVAQVLDRDFFP